MEDRDQPNIVMLLLDTATAKSFGCYGNERDVTPFFDELAEDGVMYEQAFANSIYSLPSYASIFTGQRPSDHEAIDWESSIEENRLIGGLNEQGYTTIALSNHLISDTYGFGQAFDIMEHVPHDSGRPYPDDPLINELDDGTAKERWDSTATKYLYFLKESIKRGSWQSLANGFHDIKEKLKRRLGFWDDQGAAKGVEMAEEYAIQDRPFFLFLNFIEPHFAYRPPRGYIRRFMPDDVGFNEIREATEKQLLNVSVGHGEITDRQKMILRRLHEAEIRYVNDQCTKLYDRLDEAGKTDNTVFIVLSDHGDLFGKNGIWGHRGRIYNEVAHVPLITNYHHDTAGIVSDPIELRQLCDHLLNLGKGRNERLDTNGEALIEYYGLDTQQSFEPWEEFDDVDKDTWCCYQAGLVKDGHKLIWDSNEKTELYDMETDFSETSDIAAANLETVKRLQDRITELVGTPQQRHAAYRKQKSIEIEDLDI